MIISLTGFMGCGKSSVGRRLSELLCCPFMDLDEEIESRSGRSIAEIFASDGEAEFRRIEQDTLSDIIGLPVTSIDPRRSATPPSRGWHVNSGHQAVPDNVRQIHPETDRLVLALGGGAVMTEGSAEMVHDRTICIYLKASVDTLMEHLTGETSGRPLLSDTSSQGAEPITSLRGRERSANKPVAFCSETACGSRNGPKRRGNPLQERITKLMRERSSTYERTAHHIIDTDGKTIDDIAQEIISLLQ